MVGPGRPYAPRTGSNLVTVQPTKSMRSGKGAPSRSTPWSNPMLILPGKFTATVDLHTYVRMEVLPKIRAFLLTVRSRPDLQPYWCRLPRNALYACCVPARMGKGPDMARYQVVCATKQHPHRHIVNVGTGTDDVVASGIWTVGQVRQRLE